MSKESKIYLAGHNGLVGKAIHQELKSQGFDNIITKSSKELNLKEQSAVADFFKENKPDIVILAAAKVGGIKANSDYPADFIYDNLAIELNVIHQAYKRGVKKLVFLGSSCIYPRHAPQPIKEEDLLSSPLEKTNEPYAIAKIAGLKLCESYNKQYGTDFISCMPTNLYGPGDNFDLKSSHVMPALIAKFVSAKKENKNQVEVWGTGKVKREFLYVEDLAKAVVFLMQNYQGNMPLNVGTGEDVSIHELASLIKDVVGYKGKLVFNPTYPDGTPRKLLDVSRIKKLGWEAKTPLKKGIEKTVKWYEDNYENAI
ncbi:MAG: NAD-dependent epimerase/dehydratase family protein [Chlamydiales bacterium]|nr:GDP-L-fucose synthase [Chlamydiales bacterium]NCF70457.1 NAD-dependent epimerase/dehydratase family protein [Chlamydiales bacterium]